MDAVTASYIWLAIFFVGLVLLFSAAFRKHAGPLKGVNPVLAAVIGVGLIIVGGVWGVLPNMPDQPLQQQNIIIEDEEISAPAFNIDPTAIIAVADVIQGAGVPIATAVFDATETILTVPITVNSGGTHDAFQENYTTVNFTVTPIPPTGSNADDLATIYFESDYNMKYESEYVLIVNGAESIWFANWSHGHDDATGFTTWDHNGQDTMLLTGQETYQIHYGLDGGPGTGDDFADKFKTVGESTSWSITFHNADWSWSKIYTVTLIVIVSA